MAPKSEFPARWHCTYWFPSNKILGDEPSEYTMRGYREGKTFVLESEPDASGAYMFVRLHIGTDNIVTGNWYETTSPTGDFKSANYSGAGQLILNSESFYMEGKWAGAGYDHKLKRMRIYTGNWEIKPIARKAK